MEKNIKFSIAIDGSSASGKTTASKYISKKFGFKLLSSGKLYRYLAYKMIKGKIKIKEIKKIKKICKEISMTKLNNKNLYNDEVATLASYIAKKKNIRKLLKNFQIKFSKNKKIIIEGRDITSKILPNADLKMFFTCSNNEKAKRRYKELKIINRNISLKSIKKSLNKRDFEDKYRKESPLLFIKGSVLVDTTKLNLKQMEHKVGEIYKEALKKKYGNLQ